VVHRQQAPVTSQVFGNGAPVPQPRPQFFGGGSSSIVTEIGWQIALAFVGPLVSAAATAAVGWVVYWWGRVVKTEFDQKSAEALHAALARGMLAGVQALGVRAGRRRADVLRCHIRPAVQWRDGEEVRAQP
jgi:hypothetical protein